MMKKVTYLFSILTLMVFMSCSCEKDDPIIPDPTGPITLEELNGVWLSDSYSLNETTYSSFDECEVLSSSTDPQVLDGGLMFITLTILNSDWELVDNCDSENNTDGNAVDYNKGLQTLELKHAGIQICKFDVVSYNRNTEILVLKLTANNVGAVDIPIDGIYTLTR